MKAPLTLALLACTQLLAAASAQKAPKPPNVLLIISDDHHARDYGFMGHPQIKTPHLDRLARESLLFPNGCVPSSLCSPSLSTILTGLYPHQHRVTSNDPPKPPASTGTPAQIAARTTAARKEMVELIDRVPTLPRLLARRGYRSFQTGKWWQGHYQHGGFTEGMTTGDPAKGGRHGDQGLEIGRKGLQPIFDFIGRTRSAEKPFFVWYAPMMPHSPHTPPERLLAKYRDLGQPLPVARYWAMVEWFDETCGELLDYLDREKLAQDTVVLYVADNGWLQDPSAADRFAPRSKQSPYQSGLATPLMLRWPGHVKPERSRRLATSLDFAPTLLAAAGLPKEQSMAGVNLMDTAALKKRNTLYGECFTHDAADLRDPAKSLRWRWARNGDWKLILPAPQNEPSGKAELYHLSRDPEEQNNLAAQEPERVRKLTALLDSWWPGKVASAQ